MGGLNTPERAKRSGLPLSASAIAAFRGACTIALSLEQEKAPPEEPDIPSSAPAERKRRAPKGLSLGGVDDIPGRRASCCNPVPGEPVVGFISRGRGLTIYRRECEVERERAGDGPFELFAARLGAYHRWMLSAIRRLLYSIGTRSLVTTVTAVLLAGAAGGGIAGLAVFMIATFIWFAFRLVVQYRVRVIDEPATGFRARIQEDQGEFCLPYFKRSALN